LIARAGQRCLVALLHLLSLPGVTDIPCANSGRMWLLRLGLYELLRPKLKADDWVWIADHTVQLGPLKALVIVGVRLSDWEPERGPLRHQDMTLLDLMPMRHSTGPVIEARFEAVAEETGVPRLIVADGGGDLRCGIARFQGKHAETACTYDIKHKMALLVERQLQADPRFREVQRRCEPGPFSVVVDGPGLG
jgi:hypothetical protein